MTQGTLLAGRYRLDEPIGRGGMGQVWAGHDAVLGRDVAVKLVDLTAGDDPVAADRFRREAQATAALSHPHIVTIFDSGVDEPMAFLVMERLPGPNLGVLVGDRGPLPVAEALLFAEQTAAGLSAAHGAGVVHRDVKPANLMLDQDGRVKIVDFGIARLAHTTSGQLTAADTVLGSAPYLSPEQVGGGVADERTDLYALGCVLMTLLTGEPPFSAEHPLAVLHQHLSVDAPRLSSRRADVPPQLDRLVAQLLAKAPDDRPASAEMVRSQLEAMRLGAPLLDPAAGMPATSVLPSTLAMTPVAPTERLATSPVAAAPLTARLPAGLRDRRALLLALAAGVLLVLVVTRLVGGATPVTATPPAATSTPTASAQPVVTQAPSPTASVPAPVAATPVRTLAEGLAALGAAVDAAAAAGELNPSGAQDLRKRIDDLQKSVAKGDGKDVAKKLRDLAKELQDLQTKNDLTAAGVQRLSGPVQAIQSLSAPADD